jgi:hypothetical protein
MLIWIMIDIKSKKFAFIIVIKVATLIMIYRESTVLLHLVMIISDGTFLVTIFLNIGIMILFAIASPPIR